MSKNKQRCFMVERKRGLFTLIYFGCSFVFAFHFPTTQLAALQIGQQRQTSRNRRKRQKWTWTRESHSNNGPVGQKFVLPVFPLRKAVKLPSDTLTLNLYEERYLELAEYVLRSNETVFGALYCSDKPQIMKRSGPVVPMIEPGDVGVICYVIDNDEGMVPTRGGELRRRIKLQGVAIDRFVIDRVLHDGYGGGTAPETSGITPLPFILVEALTLNDSSSATGKKLTTLERKLFDKFANDGELLGAGGKSFSDHVSLEDIFCVLPSDLKNEIMVMKPETVRFDNIQNGLSRTQRVLKARLDEEGKRREFYSFVSATNLPIEIPTKSRLRLLRLVSTEARLQFIDRIFQCRSLLSRMKSFWE